MYFRHVAWLLLLLPLFACTSTKPAPGPTSTESAPAEAAPAAELFRVGPGDTISISVWRQDDFSTTAPVDPDGYIHYPHGFTTKVSGLTLPEIETAVGNILTQYVVNPRVSVGTVSIASRKAHILGEVRSPGSITMNVPMTILEAVASAGGYSTDAAANRILLIRREGDKITTSAVHLNLRDTNSGKFSPMTPLRANDIVYVPPSRIADMERFMDRLNTILNPIINLERGIVLQPDVEAVLNGEAETSVATTTLSL